MTDDIVTRLRARKDPYWSPCAAAPTRKDSEPDKLSQEAADEIERLRADNKHLERMWIDLINTCRTKSDRVVQLREALIEISNRNIPGVIPDGYTAFQWVIHNYGILRERAGSALEEGK
jgi:hypothetical protein